MIFTIMYFWFNREYILGMWRVFNKKLKNYTKYKYTFSTFEQVSEFVIRVLLFCICICMSKAPKRKYFFKKRYTQNCAFKMLYYVYFLWTTTIAFFATTATTATITPNACTIHGHFNSSIELYYFS